MFVSEIFKSIQGEGVNAGQEAVFLRLSGCNFRCNWCDTKYAWEKGKEMSVEEVVDKVLSYGVEHLVITGGEPLLQQEELGQVLDELPERFYVELETNGSVECKLEGKLDLITCSPKLKNSGVEEYELKIGSDEKVYYKFVIERAGDVEEVKKYLRKWNIPVSRVVLMPLGTEREVVLEREAMVKKLCEQGEYIFSPRLHIVQGIK